MERKKPLRSDPEKARAWQERSTKKAVENAKKKPKLVRKPLGAATEKVRQAMSKANPPRVDAPKSKSSKRTTPGRANPGNNPAPPLEPGARCICGCGVRAVQNHHVVYRQELRRLRADAGDPRSCVPVALRCHGDHHSGARRLPLSVLPDDQIDFALEAMGAACYDYLLRRYDGSVPDPRLERVLEEAEGAT